jgi:hypothetical protein
MYNGLTEYSAPVYTWNPHWLCVLFGHKFQAVKISENKAMIYCQRCGSMDPIEPSATATTYRSMKIPTGNPHMTL